MSTGTMVFIGAVIGLVYLHKVWKKGTSVQLRQNLAHSAFRIWKVLLIASVAVLLIGNALNHGSRQQQHTANVLIYAGAWPTGILVCLIIFAGLFRLFQIYGQSIRTTMTPIPTPAEISVLLQQEWGRPATVEEVYAVHRMLTDKRNEAAFFAGAITLGALYISHKE